MRSNVLSTPIDKLVDYFKTHKTCTFTDVVNYMRYPIEILEKWFTILEDYSIIKVQFRGFEGYITYIEKEDTSQANKNKVDIDNLKKIFIIKAQEKNYSYEKMKQLWPIFIKEYERDIRLLFEDKAKERGYEIEKIQRAWLLFKKELVIF